MKCTAARDLLFRKLDNELQDSETAELDAHLAGCPACAREYGILALPNRVVQFAPPVQPSPFFYPKLRACIEGEAQKAAGWQVVLGLARQVIPALAGITLALLSVFAYFQIAGPKPDLYKAYDRVFIMEDQPHRMLAAGHGEITGETVLSAIAERENHSLNRDPK